MTNFFSPSTDAGEPAVVEELKSLDGAFADNEVNVEYSKPSPSPPRILRKEKIGADCGEMRALVTLIVKREDAPMNRRDDAIMIMAIRRGRRSIVCCSMRER